MQIDSSVRPIGGAWRPGGRHQLAQQQSGLGVRDRRLHADPDQAVGVVHRLPGVDGELAAAVVGVAVVA